MIRLRFVVAAALLVTFGERAMAQEPVRPPQDTAVVPSDTLPPTPPVFQDSVRPIPQLARPDLGPAHGLANGVWYWDRAALLLEVTTSLADLLERIPGMLTLRTGLQLQPLAGSALGGTANRIEVWLDGYILDPLTESSVDLSKIEIANLASVRVERRLGFVRIHLETMMPLDNRAHTVIEAGVGEPESNLFRGLLLAPKLFFGPFGVAIDRMDTDGLGRSEPADQFAGWLKWSYIRGQSGLQVEYRRMSTDRDPVIPWAAEHTRDDLIGRLRINLRDGLIAELFGGRSSFEGDTADPSNAEDSIPKIELTNIQWGGRVSYSTPLLWANGSLRFRDAAALPSLQADVNAGFRFGKLATVGIDLTQANWRDAGSALWYSLNGSVMPFGNARIFAEWTSGSRGAPWLYGFPNDSPFINEQSGYRVGAEVTWRGITAGGALLHTEADSAAVFGLPFDSTMRVLPGGAVDGWELSGNVPLFLRGLSGYGIVSSWYKGGVWAFMPTRLYRAGLQYHNSPLPSGNLELYGRIETAYRGTMLVPSNDTGDEAELLTQMPGRNTIDAYVQIRIIDVRIFGRFEDITGQGIQDLPDRPVAGPRIFYGVKWQFWN